MIPYDDLVVALTTWRARQGLPVAQMSGMLTPPSPIAAAMPMTQPPGPPPPGAAGRAPTSAVPPPLAPVDTRDEDVDDAALLEETHYENEGDDFAMAFAANQPAEEADFESTAIGTAPPPAPGVQRDSFGGSTEPEPPPGKHNRNDDW